jgi:hypothetical protein
MSFERRARHASFYVPKLNYLVMAPTRKKARSRSKGKHEESIAMPMQFSEERLKVVEHE